MANTIKFINLDEELALLSKNIKKDKDIFFGLILPKKIKSNEKILVIKNSDNNIMSWLWFGIYENDQLGKIIHTNCSYTFSQYRSNGLNKILRIQLEKFAIDNYIYKLTSNPLDGSFSKKILLDLGYNDNKEYFIKLLN